MHEHYVDDLLERLDSKEELPQEGPLWSSKYTVSFQAYREAEKLTDVSIVPVLGERIRKAKKVRTFQKLAVVLGGLLQNVKDQEALQAYDCLMQRAPASDAVWDDILRYARRAHVEGAIPYALRFVDKPIPGNLSFTAAIEYLGTMGGVEAIPILGDLLIAYCYGKCHPMYCVFALGEIEHPNAIRYLERARELHARSKKQVPREVAVYSGLTIERLRTLPPTTLAGMTVRAWTIPPDLPERLAICARREGVALLICDAQWQVQNASFVDVWKEATDEACTITGSQQLFWHQRPEKIR